MPSRSSRSSQKVNMNRVLTSGSNMGRTIMIISSFVLLIIGIVFLVLSIRAFITPDPKRVVVAGVVKEASCSSYNVYRKYSSSPHVTCTLKVAFKVGNVDKVEIINTDGKYNYIVGQEVQVEYDETKPSSANICCKQSHIVTGIWTLFISLLFLGGAGFNWYYRDNYFANISSGANLFF